MSSFHHLSISSRLVALELADFLVLNLYLGAVCLLDPESKKTWIYKLLSKSNKEALSLASSLL